MTKQAAPGRMLMGLVRRGANRLIRPGAATTARRTTKLLTGAPMRQIGMDMGNAAASNAAKPNFWRNLGHITAVGTSAYGIYKLREELSELFGGGARNTTEAPTQTAPAAPSQTPQTSPAAPSQTPQSRPAVPGHPDAVWTTDGSGYKYKGKNTVTDPWYRHYR